MSELARRLHKVDPDLQVVSGLAHRHGAGRQEWLAATGVICSKCGREVFRSRDGMCLPCWDQAHEFEVRDTCGALEFLPESVIDLIVHDARKEVA